MVFNTSDGKPIWFWQHDLPFEPLPEGLAVNRDGQLIVATLEGHILQLAPRQPPPAAVRKR